MKKLVLAFALMVAMSFASCGGNTGSSVAANDSIDTTEVVTDTIDSIVADTLSADSTVAE